MQQRAVAHGVFQRVRQRVAEVELHAHAVVMRVKPHILRLDGAAAGDDLIEHRHEPLARAQAFQTLKQRAVVDAAVLDDLAQARADLACVERLQRVAVHEHQLRLIERAQQVLAARVVDGHFAADGGIDLRKQRGGHLHEVHAAQIGAGGVARDVAHDAAAQRDHQVRAREVRVKERVIEPGELRGALGLLTRGQDDDGRLHAGAVQLLQQRIGIQRRGVAVRDDGGPAALVGRKQRRTGSKQAVGDVNVIPAFGGVGGHRDDGHGVSSLSSQINGL